MSEKKEKNTKDSTKNSLIQPENMGRLDDPSGSAWIEGLCGDRMEMYLVIEKEKVKRALFYTNGCNASRVCGSTAAHLAEGKSLKEVLRLSPAESLDTWSDIPQGNVHCTILAIGTLHKAVADYLFRTQLG